MTTDPDDSVEAARTDHLPRTGPPFERSRIVTVGHGTLASEELLKLLHTANIERLVDIRSFPGSRRNPQFGREVMGDWVPAGGVEYEWVNDLGGRRKPVPNSRHVVWHNESFRAYADYMETDSFRAGIVHLLERAAVQQCAIMCSESVWWRCHRRMVADYLVLMESIEVVHLMHDNRLTVHTPTEGVRATNERLVYDVGVTAPLLSDGTTSR